jgi:hypothetical protein
MAALPLDVPAWTRGARAAEAAQRRHARIEKEARAAHAAERERLAAALAAERAARDAQQRAEERWLQQRVLAEQLVHRGVRGGHEIVAAFAHCRREQHGAERAAAAAEHSSAERTARADDEAAARQRWAAQRARRDAAADVARAQRCGLVRAREWLAELDAEEDSIRR